MGVYDRAYDLGPTSDPWPRGPVPTDGRFVVHPCGLDEAHPRDELRHLQRALASNRRIDAAVGILSMSSRPTTQAFARLRQESQKSNISLPHATESVLYPGILGRPSRTLVSLPGQVSPGAVRSDRLRAATRKGSACTST